MNQRILLTGADGYIGRAFSTYLKGKGIDSYDVDSYGRGSWVMEVGGVNLGFQGSPTSKVCDLINYDTVLRILKFLKPTHIFHLASQPSAPYSESTPERKRFTQLNNLLMLRNLLDSAKELNLDCSWIVTTTTGVPGAPNQPIEEAPMPNLAGSAYHVSRGFDSANLSLAAKQWKFRILELRTSIVYGVAVDGIDSAITRFDWDYYFGVVLHRFLLKKLKKEPVTVYGKGEQRKPIICLRDVVQSLFNCLSYDIKPGHEIMNQTTQCLEIMTIANQMRAEICHIENPRTENEEHKMVINNQKFLRLLTGNPTLLQTELPILEKLVDLKRLPRNWEFAYDGK